jgi:hypothetical protein
MNWMMSADMVNSVSFVHEIEDILTVFWMDGWIQMVSVVERESSRRWERIGR